MGHPRLILITVLIPSLAGPLSSVSLSAGTIVLDFDAAVPGTIRDASGNGTGLTARLPGTGSALPTNDPNLALAGGALRITSTNSDLNGQLNLGIGEYLGTRLADLGFTGSEDFSIGALIRDVAYTQDFDQFGLFVGADPQTNFRAGALFGNFAGGAVVNAVSNRSGIDIDPAYNPALAPLNGDAVRLTLSRTGGIFQFAIQNLTDPARSGPLAIIQPTFLNARSDLYVGIYAANARNNVQKVISVDSYVVGVVPEPSSLLLAGLGASPLAAAAGRRRIRGRLAGPASEE